MDAQQERQLRQLVHAQPVAALGTLHEGRPFVSMVPYAVLPDSAAFVIHVSGLAAHTRDMLAAPAVSLMVMDTPAPGVPAQALARVTVQGRARRLANEGADYAQARATYLSRFPDSAYLFEFPDFALFAIEPESARWIGGYAQARTISAETLAAILRPS